MTLWRISRHPELNGAGGLRGSARWHTQGHLIVYCAPTPATALLEVLVHAGIDIEDIPTDLQYLEIEAPSGPSIEDLNTNSLSQHWPNDLETTRSAGDRWLESSRTALLRVPSVIVPATWNVLVNPRHPDSAQIRIVRTHRQGLDARLRR